MPDWREVHMKKIRCTDCGRTLLLIDYGRIEIKCPRCGHVMEIEKEKDNEQSERPRAAESTDPLDI